MMEFMLKRAFEILCSNFETFIHMYEYSNKLFDFFARCRQLEKDLLLIASYYRRKDKRLRGASGINESTSQKYVGFLSIIQG